MASMETHKDLLVWNAYVARKNMTWPDNKAKPLKYCTKSVLLDICNTLHIDVASSTTKQSILAIIMDLPGR